MRRPGETETLVPAGPAERTGQNRRRIGGETEENGNRQRLAGSLHRVKRMNHAVHSHTPNKPAAIDRGPIQGTDTRM